VGVLVAQCRVEPDFHVRLGHRLADEARSIPRPGTREVLDYRERMTVIGYGRSRTSQG
jgi:hypothetical protein